MKLGITPNYAANQGGQNSNMSKVNKQCNPSFGYNLEGLRGFIEHRTKPLGADQVKELKQLVSDPETSHIHIKPSWSGSTWDLAISDKNRLPGLDFVAFKTMTSEIIDTVLSLAKNNPKK